jgi:hypothetical protein
MNTIINVDTLNFKMEPQNCEVFVQIKWEEVRNKIIEIHNKIHNDQESIESLTAQEFLRYGYGIEDCRKCTNIELLKNIRNACAEYPSPTKLGFNIVYGRAMAFKDELETDFIPSSEKYLAEQKIRLEEQKSTERLKKSGSLAAAISSILTLAARLFVLARGFVNNIF